MRIALLFVPLAALASCATPENRVRTALLDAGLAPPLAGCMADRLTDRLSIAQLRRLSTLSSMRGRRVQDVSISELLGRLRDLGDPEIVSVVTTAGLGCAIAT